VKVLFEAIYNYWASEGKFGLSELYLVEAKGEAVFPYATFSTSIVSDWTFTETGEDCLIMFTLFSKTPDTIEICAIFEALKDSFDFHDLVVAGYGTIGMSRGPANLIKEEGVWKYSITYRLQIEKT